ncbi:MAG: hypothetical protein CBB97_22430 [Candidatus Endolissoclinum sp. TMED37]|nr:MAG: hypothetical protein CBB97_22430 [Candidatus Endolissoclinum sp. TMED37]
MFPGLEFASSLAMICRIEFQGLSYIDKNETMQERLCVWRCQDNTTSSRIIGKENQCPSFIYEPRPEIKGGPPSRGYMHPSTEGNVYKKKDTSPRVWNNREGNRDK